MTRTCPKCRANLTSVPVQNGKLRCPNCKALLTVARADDRLQTTPAAGRRTANVEGVLPDARKQTPVRRKSNAVPIVPILLGVGLGLVLLLVLASGLVFFLFFRQTSETAVATVQPEAQMPDARGVRFDAEPAKAPPRQAAAEANAAPSQVELEAAAVYVKGRKDTAVWTGSGFVVHAQGNTVYVATAHYVASPPPQQTTERLPQPSPDSAAIEITLVFHSGTAQEQSLPATVVADDAVHDLAIVRAVGVLNVPRPIAYQRAPDLRKTAPATAFGFPFGNDLNSNKASPLVTVTKGRISSVRDPGEPAELVQLDLEINPGNGGGPVVDEKGDLIGLVRSKVPNTHISFAIPAAKVKALLQGRIDPPRSMELRNEQGRRQVRVRAPALDPLGKLRSPALLYGLSGEVRMPARGPNGWESLSGAKSVELTLQGMEATAMLRLTEQADRQLQIIAQVRYQTETGETVYGEPRTLNLDADKPPIVAGLPAQPEKPAPSRASAPRPDQPPDWETVTSKEGQFNVEMPAKPSLNDTRTRNSPAGKVQTIMIGCTTPGGMYIVYRVLLPTPVLRGAEDRALDSERDYFAKEFNGRVISEKKVRAQGILGRDFTVRGQPAQATGILTIRIREYLIGRAVFAMAVVSAPNRELPVDTGRFLGSLTIGEEKKRAAGTPEPEPAGREVAGWGSAIDPDKDCEILAEQKKLTIRVPGSWHDLNPDTGKLNSPRVLHEVEGDFVVKVKVQGEFKPGGKSTNPRGVPYYGAGILIWSDSDNFIRLERGALFRDNKVKATIAFEEREGGYRGAVHNITSPPGPVYLRLERKGSRILGAVSFDDITWRPLQPIDTLWPAKLKVGLSAISSSSQPFEAQFTEHSLQTQAAGL